MIPAAEMKLTEIQNLAIQARMALIVGAKTFDHLLAGVHFDEFEAGLLYVYAKDEEIASDIEDSFTCTSHRCQSDLEARGRSRGVLPKVLQ